MITKEDKSDREVIAEIFARAGLPFRDDRAMSSPSGAEFKAATSLKVDIPNTSELIVTAGLAVEFLFDEESDALCNIAIWD